MIEKPTPFRIQNMVVFALFIREMKNRFVPYRLGYFWAFIDPMAHVLAISIFYLVGLKSSSIAGIPAPLIIVTGVVPFQFFQFTMVSNMRAVETNLGLFNYQRVKPSDAVTARILLESVITLLVLLILLGSFAYFGYQVDVVNLLEAIATFGLLITLCFGLGLIACVLGVTYPETKKIIPVIIRPLYFVSGIFFAVDSIPEPYRAYLLINPFVHVIDLLRASLFSNFTSQSANFEYLGWWSLTILFIGLAYYRVNRMSIITSKNQ